MSDLVQILESHAASFLQGILEGKALATHRAPSGPLRAKHSKAAREVMGQYRGAVKRLAPQFHAAMESQFANLQSRFRARLRALYRAWERTGDIDAFKAASRQAFEDHYRKVFQLGMTATDLTRHAKPGVRVRAAALVTPSDRAWIASAAREELGYWNKFLSDLQFGRWKADPFRRIDWYVKSAEAPYHAGRVVALPHLSAIRWIYSPIVEKHCAGCLYLSTQGPFTKESLPCTPRDGTTICRFNCKCRLEYYDVDEDEYAKLSKKNRKFIHDQAKARR